ncbi:GNAT family N-acetyltransferase [Leptolyngbya sp. FACHB-261]|uniref:GNAT family N-acetyltransferase n=1 Tax=Leptolyngbya sp. FACHB-261 TaxID=2692806 RepID=UPI001687C562|nr:GNAT family N-acetyltransferase [Leptolyngbya sp. FACHB-261]MBD2099967.1 GNAT family N-acetyltransferase [Leptolyngbya sp. FACHB-261]
MSQIIFETERLVGRRLEPDDLTPMLAIYGDAEAMRWVGDGQPITEEQCVKWLEVTENNYRVRGYGMFALVERSSQGVIGFCGLVHPGGQNEAEIKYALARRYWGLGLATEAATAMLTFAATVVGLHRVIATTAPENIASHKVLLKAGMAREELRLNDDGSYTQVFGWRYCADRNSCR